MADTPLTGPLPSPQITNLDPMLRKAVEQLQQTMAAAPPERRRVGAWEAGLSGIVAALNPQGFQQYQQAQQQIWQQRMEQYQAGQANRLQGAATANQLATAVSQIEQQRMANQAAITMGQYLLQNAEPRMQAAEEVAGILLGRDDATSQALGRNLQGQIALYEQVAGAIQAKGDLALTPQMTSYLKGMMDDIDSSLESAVKEMGLYERQIAGIESQEEMTWARLGSEEALGWARLAQNKELTYEQIKAQKEMTEARIQAQFDLHKAKLEESGLFKRKKVAPAKQAFLEKIPDLIANTDAALKIMFLGSGTDVTGPWAGRKPGFMMNTSDEILRAQLDFHLNIIKEIALEARGKNLTGIEMEIFGPGIPFTTDRDDVLKVKLLEYRAKIMDQIPSGLSADNIGIAEYENALGYPGLLSTPLDPEIQRRAISDGFGSHVNNTTVTPTEDKTKPGTTVYGPDGEPMTLGGHLSQ